MTWSVRRLTMQTFKRTPRVILIALAPLPAAPTTTQIKNSPHHHPVCVYVCVCARSSALPCVLLGFVGYMHYTCMRAHKHTLTQRLRTATVSWLEKRDYFDNISRFLPYSRKHITVGLQFLKAKNWGSEAEERTHSPDTALYLDGLLGRKGEV